MQVATINSEEERIVHLLNKGVQQLGVQGEDFSAEQRKDKELNDAIQFLTEGSLPDDDKAARKIAILATSLAVVDGILYFVDSKRDHRRRCAVPSQLRHQVMEESHSGPMAGHFSGEKLYKSLVTGKACIVMLCLIACLVPNVQVG